MSSNQALLLVGAGKGGIGASCGNLMGNPKAETDTSGWTTFSGNTIERITDIVGEGLSLTGLPDGVTTMFKCTYAAHPAALRSSGSSNFPSGTFDTGTEYTGTAYVWVPSANTTANAQYTTINFSDGERDTPEASTTDQWERLDTRRLTDTDITGDLTVDFVNTPTAGDIIYVTAVQFELGTTPTDYCDP